VAGGDESSLERLMPLARDSFLDPIRKDPAYIQFMAEMKTRWEGYRREFESEAPGNVKTFRRGLQ
jgi:hypothetical protein